MCVCQNLNFIRRISFLFVKLDGDFVDTRGDIVEIFGDDQRAGERDALLVQGRCRDQLPPERLERRGNQDHVPEHAEFFY